MRIPLVTGSYVARSIIASGQRCVNLFPEKNPEGSVVPYTFYQRPGLRPLVQGEFAPVRGLYRASNGQGYCVIGQSVYRIHMTATGWTLQKLGTMTGGRLNPVSWTDNGATTTPPLIMLVDGSATGYQINMTTDLFGPVIDPTGTFQGATLVDYIDTFMLWGPVAPGNNQFGSTLSNSITFDALYIAGKTGYPDPLVGIKVNRHEILLFGQVRTELWYDAGNPQFPFAELPGSYIEHGLLAPYSVATSDITTYWLSQDQQGQGIVLGQRGYETKRVSDHGVEYAIRQMMAKGPLTDTLGYTYQQDGHTFYVLNFVSGDQTWVMDESTGTWHQRASMDGNGNLHRERGQVYANLFGTCVVGDWENGTLYALDLSRYSDTDIKGIVTPMQCIRTFPHIGVINQGGSSPPTPIDGRRTTIQAFTADIECGEAPLDSQGNPAQVSLRISMDRGRTYGNAMTQTMGTPGDFISQPVWKVLGMSRDPIFELSYAVDGPAALNGAWAEITISAS